jgi:ERF superfamily
MEIQSENIDKVSEALASAQGEIRLASKDGANPHFKSKYTTYEELRLACREPLSKNGLAITHQLTYTQDFKRVMITQVSHVSGQWMRSYLMLPQDKETPQGVGSSLTYCRRYSLSCLLAMGSGDESEDDGEKAETAYRESPSKSSVSYDVLTTDQVKYLESILMPEDREFKAWLFNSVSEQIKRRISSFADIPANLFEVTKKTMLNRLSEVKKQSNSPQKEKE